LSDKKGVEKAPFMSDTAPPMTKEKKFERITVRLEAQLFELARSLARERGAADISDYVRGLLVVDAVTENKPLGGTPVPGWLIEKGIIVPSLRPRSSVKSPAEEDPGGQRAHGQDRKKLKPRGGA
jgi:hypothetical protein